MASSSSSAVNANAANPPPVLSDLKKLLDSTIRPELEVAEHGRDGSEGDAHHLKELKRFAYEAEDVLQDAEYLRLQGRIEGTKKERPEDQVCIHPNTCQATSPPCWKCIELKAGDVLIRHKEAEGQKNILKCSEGDGKTRRGVVSERSPTGPIPNERKILGRDVEMEEVVEFLSADASARERFIADAFKEAKRKNIVIMPIVGGAGIGKTSLVQHVYTGVQCKEETGHHFALKGWVWAYGRKGASSLKEAVLQSMVGERDRFSQLKDITKLKGKRILLVLDDVWEKKQDFWTPLEYVAEGSVVIVTTQNYSVMEAMPKDIPQTDPFVLQPLSFECCSELFRAKASRASRKRDLKGRQVLEEMGKKIVETYEGLPLAIKVAVNKLCSEQNKEEFVAVLERDSFDSFWKMGYRDLPAHLKSCFTYFALFPKDYIFKEDYLIRLWMAEGFIQSNGDDGLEKTGHEYFHDLLYRSFLQHHEDGEYKVPSDAHDLACSIAGDYIYRIHDNKEPKIPSNVRHLSFVVGTCKEDIHCPPEKADNLRTFIAIRSLRGIACLKLSDCAFRSMGYLRSLDLSYSNLEDLPESIGYLKHLHYLGLNCTPIKFLPDSICRLYSLQTLQLKSCPNLRGLPNDIGNLIELRHLDLDVDLTSFCFPTGIGKLKDLQTLPVFNVGKSDNGYGGLNELQGLGNIKGELCIMGLCNVSSKNAIPDNLENMKALRYLTLCWSMHRVGSHNDSNLERVVSNDSTTMQVEQVLESLKPSTNLSSLTIQSYDGTRFPGWMALESFTSIKFLKLQNCMKCECLPPLGLLPVLKRLVIDGVSIKRINRGFCGKSGGFPAIELLCIQEMSELREWCEIEDGAFPKLEELQLFNCPKLANIPQKIFPRKTLSMENCEKLSELPGLTYVETLKMVNCDELATFSTSTSLKNLELLGCGNLKEIPEIPSLETLKMENCEDLTTFPTFPSLKYLELLGCDKLKEIPEIPSLETLKMENCKDLTTFPTFPSLKDLELLGCDKLKEIPKCPSLETLKMDNCKECDVIEPGNLFPKLDKLELVNCPKFRLSTSFATLSTLKTLQLCACNGLESLPSFSSLTRLEVMYCNELKTLSCPSLLKSLWVEDCQKVSFPSSRELLKLETLFISNCNPFGLPQKELCQLSSSHQYFEVGNTLIKVQVD